jgi:hypothetical protein
VYPHTEPSPWNHFFSILFHNYMRLAGRIFLNYFISLYLQKTSCSIKHVFELTHVKHWFINTWNMLHFF